MKVALPACKLLANSILKKVAKWFWLKIGRKKQTHIDIYDISKDYNLGTIFYQQLRSQCLQSIILD